MDTELRALLADLYTDGTTHDAAQPDRLRRRRNLEPDAAELLTLVLRMAGAREVVEIGTSNGYSAIWLADAVRDTGGTVTSVDVEEWPGAATNIDRSELSAFVRREISDGGAYLAGLADASVDLLFLDAERVRVPGLVAAPRPGAAAGRDPGRRQRAVPPGRGRRVPGAGHRSRGCRQRDGGCRQGPVPGLAAARPGRLNGRGRIRDPGRLTVPTG